jgi:hypothetical protein
VGGSSFNWFGTVVSVFFGFLLKAGYDEARNTYIKFGGECRIKGELEDVAHSLWVAGRPNEKIMVNYGADYIRYHSQPLFGGHNPEVLGWYIGFDEYNSELEGKSYDKNSLSQHSMINRMIGVLSP